MVNMDRGMCNSAVLVYVMKAGVDHTGDGYRWYCIQEILLYRYTSVFFLLVLYLFFFFLFLSFRNSLLGRGTKVDVVLIQKNAPLLPGEKLLLITIFIYNEVASAVSISL